MMNTTNITKAERALEWTACAVLITSSVATITLLFLGLLGR